MGKDGLTVFWASGTVNPIPNAFLVWCSSAMINEELPQHAARLFSTALSTVLQHHMLPKLAAADLCRLAATCKALRNLVTTADVHIWQQKALAAIPWHPALPSSIPAIQAALETNATRVHSLSAGATVSPTLEQDHKLSNKLRAASISPDCTLLAYGWSAEDGSSCGIGFAALGQHAEPSSIHLAAHQRPISLAWQVGPGRLRTMIQHEQSLQFLMFDVWSGKVIASVTMQHDAERVQCFWSANSHQVMVGEVLDFPESFSIVDIIEGTVLALTAPSAWPAAPDGSLATGLTCETACWSNDNSRVACICDVDGTSMMVFYDSCSGSPVMARQGDAETTPVSWAAGLSELLTHDCEYACWLPDNATFVVPEEADKPREDDWDDRPVVVDFCRLSLADGACTSIAAKHDASFHLQPESLECIRSAAVSPNGIYAALLWYDGDDRVDAYGCIIDMQLSRGFMIPDISIDICQSRWSPCSRWLAVLLSNGAEIIVVDTSTTKNGHANVCFKQNLPLYDAKENESRINIENWQLLWSSEGASIAVLGWACLSEQDTTSPESINGNFAVTYLFQFALQ